MVEDGQHVRTSHHPDFARRAAQGALESASACLRVIYQPYGESSARARGFRRGREERELESWARHSGCWLDPAQGLLREFMRGGEEHRLIPPEGRLHVSKAAYPRRCGFTVGSGPVYPGLAEALPGEYLERLRLGNEYFGDDVRLEGVTREDERLVILTSQPNRPPFPRDSTNAA